MLLPVWKGPKVVIFDIIFAPQYVYSLTRDKISPNPDFSDSLFVAYNQLNLKLEQIYPFFVFSQGSRNGQQFSKKLFFLKK